MRGCVLVYVCLFVCLASVPVSVHAAAAFCLYVNACLRAVRNLRAGGVRALSFPSRVSGCADARVRPRVTPAYPLRPPYPLCVVCSSEVRKFSQVKENGRPMSKEVQNRVACVRTAATPGVGHCAFAVSCGRSPLSRPLSNRRVARHHGKRGEEKPPVHCAVGPVHTHTHTVSQGRCTGGMCLPFLLSVAALEASCNAPVSLALRTPPRCFLLHQLMSPTPPLLFPLF